MQILTRWRMARADAIQGSALGTWNNYTIFISIESIFLYQLKRLVPVKDALIAVLVLAENSNYCHTCGCYPYEGTIEMTF